MVAFDYVRALGEETALERMRRGLHRYLIAKGVPAAKFHETRTAAWVRIVAHVNEVHARDGYGKTQEALLRSLGDSSLLARHYSDATLESDGARQHFVEPDLRPLPPAPRA